MGAIIVGESYRFIALFLFLWSRSKLKAIQGAEQIIKYQFEKVEPKVVDELVEHAKRIGHEDYVLGVLKDVRMTYGHQEVKVEHVAWIMHLINEGCPDLTGQEIPSFQKPKI